MHEKHGGSGFLNRRVESTSTLARISISSVLLADTRELSMRIPISAKVGERTVETKALIDCGAQGCFLDQDFVKKHQIPTFPLSKPIPANNVDGTLNKKGDILEATWLEVNLKGRTERIRFLISGLGKDHLILGMTWLKRTNPDIDWNKGTVRFDERRIKRTMGYALRKSIECRLIDTERRSDEPKPETEIIDTEQPRNEPKHEYFDPEDYDDEGDPMTLWIRAKTTISQKLAQASIEPKEPKTIEEMIPPIYLKYRKVFEKQASERLPESRPWDHAIDLKPDFVPRNCKIYPLTPQEQILQDRFLEENLRKGYIRPSKSPMASPFFFVAKKEENALRPCQDYRQLNEGTVKNVYPLPLIGDLLDRMKGAEYFTKLDIRWGYHNVRIKEGDQWKAAFKTNKGLFEPVVMFFGLCNSPPTFQAMMNEIFADMIAEGWLEIYMDDMGIHSDNLEEHQRRTLRVLRRMEENDLYLKPEKCTFDARQMEYLGLIITPGKIEMDPTKLAGIRDWPTPTTVKHVRSFLGFANFYRKFIGHYAEIAKPLNNLTHLDKKFEWDEETENAFQALKSAFAKTPVLIMPDSTKPFLLECDASKWALGAVLKQQDMNGDWHPCGFISRTFDQTQRNYDVGDRELLAIITALETWRHYLQGSPHPVTVFSDHKNLTYFKSPQKLNRRQARWNLTLSQYDLKLVHIPGQKMVQSDALSRRPDHILTEDDDNENVILLPETMFLRQIDLELRNAIIEAMTKDDFPRNTIETLKKGGPPPIKSDLKAWEIREELLFFNERCYVPANEELRRNIVKKFHDLPPMAHPGQYKTMEAIRKYYWWPGMYTFIRNYVMGCATCQQNKVNTHPTTPPLMPIRSNAGRPFAIITTDFITDLPISEGYDSLMVVVDHGLTKGVILIPCTKTIDALGTADAYLDHVYRRFGLPDTIISDRGPQFASQVFRNIGKTLGIDLRMSTAYHPQTDGETERVNQELEVYLRIFCGNNPDKWRSFLPIMEFAHNNRTHETTKQTPFYLMGGYEPKAFPIAFENTNIPSVEQRMVMLQRARDEAKAAHELARQKMAERITRGFKPFKKGDQVWLEGKNLKTLYESKKISPKREGPFEIQEVLGPLTYRLTLPVRWKIHPVFHAALLTPYRQTQAYGPNYPNPPPDLIEGEEEYEVEAIIAWRKRGRTRQYLIKWKGYPTSDNSWEPESNLKRSRRLLETYKQRHHL